MRDRTGQLKTHLLLIGQSASCSSGSTLAIAEHVCSFAFKSRKRGHIPTRSFKSCVRIGTGSLPAVRDRTGQLRTHLLLFEQSASCSSGSTLAISVHVYSFWRRTRKNGPSPYPFPKTAEYFPFLNKLLIFRFRLSENVPQLFTIHYSLFTIH